MNGLIYVYSVQFIVYFLDWLNEWIIQEKIVCWPLQYTFRLYFYMLYYIFYRNLFSRLNTASQYFTIQIGSSLWVLFYYMIFMSKSIYNISVKWFGTKGNAYMEYIRNIGRSYYLRNIAENATMFGFIIWMNVLYWTDYNKDIFPYFKFNTEDDYYSYKVTMLSYLGIWMCELFTTWICRSCMKRFFNLDISRESLVDFLKYPDVVAGMFWVILHVEMDCLLALIDLNNFSN